MPHPVIHINGWPGTGKLTIAKHLAKLLSSFDAKLVHNHLLIEPVDAVLHRTQDGYQSLRHAVRAAVFSSLVHEPATYKSIYVFTDFQCTGELGHSVCAEYAQCANERGASFIPVNVDCSVDTNLQRLVSKDRIVFSKLTDVELVRQFRQTGVVHEFSEHPNALKVDVTQLRAEEAAQRIYEHVLQVCPELSKTDQIL